MYVNQPTNQTNNMYVCVCTHTHKVYRKYINTDKFVLANKKGCVCVNISGFASVLYKNIFPALLPDVNTVSICKNELDTII